MRDYLKVEIQPCKLENIRSIRFCCVLCPAIGIRVYYTTVCQFLLNVTIVVDNLRAFPIRPDFSPISIWIKNQLGTIREQGR